mgnify:CR=1 FL=1
MNAVLSPKERKEQIALIKSRLRENKKVLRSLLYPKDCYAWGDPEAVLKFTNEILLKDITSEIWPTHPDRPHRQTSTWKCA